MVGSGLIGEGCLVALLGRALLEARLLRTDKVTRQRSDDGREL